MEEDARPGATTWRAQVGQPLMSHGFKSGGARWEVKFLMVTRGTMRI